VVLHASSTADVVVRASLNGVTKDATIHVSATGAALSTFTADKTTIQESQSATLTVTLTATPSGTAHVTLTNDDAALGSLSAAFVDISGQTSDSSVTFTAAPGVSGTAHLHASYNGTTKDLTLDVFKPSVPAL